MPDGWRTMWLLVFYDLPVVIEAERKAATRFHHFLVKQGFERLHFSVYSRFCGSMERALGFERRIEKALPRRGHVCLLKMTDRQMTNMRRWVRDGYGANIDAAVTPPAQYRMF